MLKAKGNFLIDFTLFYCLREKRENITLLKFRDLKRLRNFECEFIQDCMWKITVEVKFHDTKQCHGGVDPCDGFG